MSLSRIRSNETSKLSIKELLIIPKPRKKKSDICRTENEDEQFFFDNKKINKANKLTNFQENRSKSESFSYWLKPGVSLPKVHSDEKAFRRPDAQKHFSKISIPEFVPCVEKLKKHEKIVPKSFLTQEPLNSILDITKEKTNPEEFQNVCGLSKCSLEFNVSSTKLNFDNFEIYGDEVEESHALKQWEIWLRRRKRLQDYLQKKLNRPASRLILNRSEKFQQVIESRAVETYCNIIKSGTKAVKKNEKILCQTVCFGESLPKKKKPQIEFVGLPQLIKKEKNLIKDFDKSQTVKETNDKITICQNKIPCRLNKKQDNKNIELQRVDIENLAVVGQKYRLEDSKKLIKLEYSTSTQNMEELPEKELFHTSDPSTESEPPDIEERPAIFYLVIGDTEIKYEIGSNFHPNLTDENLTWKINFGSNPTGTILEKTLTVENKGTVATSYYWICPEVKFEETFDLIKPPLDVPWFFFNKNSGIFLPGEKYDMKFYSIARRTGTRTEVWCMKTNPPVTKNNKQLRIILSSFATINFIEPQIDSVEKYLNKKVGIFISKKILNNIIMIVTDPRYARQDIEYRSLLLEKNLFEFQNPKHYYNNYELKDLKIMYLKNVCVPEREWDFSFETLLNVVMNCVYEKSKRQILIKKISETSKKLLRPNYVTEPKNRKYRMAFDIVSSLLSSIDEDWNYLNDCLSFKTNEKMSFCLFENESFYGESNWEERGESIIFQNLFEMSPNNLLYLKTTFYIKVYNKLCEAAERIAGMLESKKFTEISQRNCCRPYM